MTRSSVQDDWRVAKELHENDIETLSRYSLRARGPKQLKPYEYDKRMYQLQMRSNPEAIIKTDNPRRVAPRKGTDEDDEEEPHPADEDDDKKRGEWHRRRNETTTELLDAEVGDHDTLCRYPQILQEGLSSDEDDDGQRALVKEAIRLQKQKRRLRTKTREEKDKQQRHPKLLSHSSQSREVIPPSLQSSMDNGSLVGSTALDPGRSVTLLYTLVLLSNPTLKHHSGQVLSARITCQQMITALTGLTHLKRISLSTLRVPETRLWKGFQSI
jgi:hypothetical protein